MVELIADKALLSGGSKQWEADQYLQHILPGFCARYDTSEADNYIEKYKPVCL